MLRLVVQMISLEPVDLPRRGTRVRIQWMSGAVDEHIIDRPVNGTARKLAMRIQELLNRDKELDNRQIAKRLNDEGADRHTNAMDRGCGPACTEHVRPPATSQAAPLGAA